MRGASQLKVGLRVGDLEASCALYLKLGFRQIPRPDEPRLRYLTFGRTWLILSDRYQHGYHNAGRERAAVSGPLGSGVVLAVPVSDLSATYDLWRSEGLTVTLEPHDAYWARIFYGLDPDGYELMFEEDHQGTPLALTIAAGRRTRPSQAPRNGSPSVHQSDLICALPQAYTASAREPHQAVTCARWVTRADCTA